jgi:hypothetical protein
MIISCSVAFRMRSVSDQSYRENQDTYFISNNFFRKSRRLLDNVEKCGRARKATDNTSSEYLILAAFTWQQSVRESFSSIVYT